MEFYDDAISCLGDVFDFEAAKKLAKIFGFRQWLQYEEKQEN